MFLSIRHKPHRAEAIKTEVINKDTGEKIPHVIWANDATGRYRQYLTDEKGGLLIERSGPQIAEYHYNKKGEIVEKIGTVRILSKIFTGNIELRKVK